MPDDEHGTLSGYYSVSRGVGICLGPLAAGLVLSLTSSLFPDTNGYQAMWLPVAAAALLSLLPLRALHRA